MRVSRHRKAETHTRTGHTQTFMAKSDNWPFRNCRLGDVCQSIYDIFTKGRCSTRAPISGADKVALEALAKEGDDM